MTSQESNLPSNGFILSADYIASLVLEEENNDYQKFPSKEPSAFITGLAYYAGTAPLTPEQLEHVPVGIQEHAIEPGSIVIKQDEAEGHPASTLPSSIDTAFTAPEATFSEARTVAKKIQKQSAKQTAIDAARKRVSRRLLMAERSKHLTVACPITGIISILEIPNIPFPQKNPQLAKAMLWTSPFGSLENCRGLAQQGLHYLRKLDTQILAGILIVVAEHYELFKFQPFDSASQKNAILRTAGKDAIIDAVILIEELVHSGNHRFLPKLSLVYDEITEREGLEVRMQSYLKILADAIALPDKEAYDDKKILPMYPIRPQYIRDAEIAIKKAKKEFSEDIKAGKIAIGQLQKQVLLSPKMREFLGALFNGDGMLVMPAVVTDKIIEKLETYNNGNAEQLIVILKKDRKALKLDISELAEEASGEAAEETTAEEKDDSVPGAEPMEVSTYPGGEDQREMDHIELGEDEDESFQDTEGDAYVEDMTEAKAKEEEKEQTIPQAPEGLRPWEQLLWKKKMAAALVRKEEKRNIIQNDIPSTASYVPTSAKERLAK